MNRSLKIVAVLVILFGLGGYGLYAYVTAPTKAPTQTASESEQPLPPVGDLTPPAATDTAPEMAPSTDGKFHIVSEKTTATFTLNEVLRGEPKTVIGTTHDVSGEVDTDIKDLDETTRIGTIRINARTFVTDSDQRNNAIRRMILKTEDDANEYIEFSPKSVNGLPDEAVIGKAIPIEVTGDLKVSGQTKEVTFKGSVTFTSETEMTGTVDTKIHYPDWNVSVPNLPFLANVDQDVALKLDFTATK